MSTTGDGPGGDYSYDMAHDDLSGTAETPEPTSEETAVPAPTEAQDSDGDYSYDLVHEVPPTGEEPAGP